MNNNLSENLKKIRKDNNLSQEQLAEELGVSRQAISKWESGAAYPEMDKIIQLCNKFELNIDDLLNKDIREIKGEETSKNNINKAIDNFLKFVTDTINLFDNLNFKSKIKCIFEQIVIVLILLIICFTVGFIFDICLDNLFIHFSSSICHFIRDALIAIYEVFCLVVSIGVIVHIFKVRYLDYFAKLKDNNIKEDEETLIQEEDVSKSKNCNKENKAIKMPKEERIIIRDPKDSEDSLAYSILRIFVYGVKFFALIVFLFLCMGLIGLVALLVASFIISKTGVFFGGLLLVFIALSVIDVIMILLLLNFIFNRKNNKKLLIWTFISSIIILGIGTGLIFIGSLKFEYIDAAKDDNLKTTILEVDMNDNLYFEEFEQIEFIEKNISNIEISVSTNNLVKTQSHINQKGEIQLYTYSSDFKTVLDEVIKNINEYKIIELDRQIYNVKVYASKENITILKSNFDKNKKFVDEKQKIISNYEKQITEYKEIIREYENRNCNE